MKTLRDFIYLDTLRVKSLASQLNEGLAESRKIERAGAYETASELAKESSTATSELRLTEERLLLDHIYNELEASITLASPQSGVRFSLSQNPLIKVSGQVEIEDYRVFLSLLQNYNKLGQIIGYPTFPEKRFSSLKERDTAIAAHAAKLGLQQDPVALENISTFVKLLTPDALNFLFDATAETGHTVRAVLDRRWLRYEEAFLRGLYAAHATAPWTVVGIVTYVPSEVNDTPPTHEVSANMMPDGTPNMGASYRNMFRHSKFFSNMFFRSLGNELIVLPLAIYREFTISTKR